MSAHVTPCKSDQQINITMHVSKYTLQWFLNFGLTCQVHNSKIETRDVSSITFYQNDATNVQEYFSLKPSNRSKSNRRPRTIESQQECLICKSTTF
jgi:hypothetical protein